jgi:site-specific DNA-methyltransferase (adenine-specific)
VVGSSAVLRLNFCAKNPPLRQAANRYPQCFLLVNEVACIDWNDGIKQVFDNTIDLILTDPPYGIAYQSNLRKEKHKSIQNDTDLHWLGDWCKELKRVCKPEAHIYVFCSWHNIDVFKQTLGAYFNVKNILVWEKNNHGSGDLLGDYAPKYELIIFCSNGSKKLNGGRSSNVIKCAKIPTDNHPTEKPTNLLRHLIEKSTNKGDLVLDTFAGSFSTARACKEIGRNFICFEVEPEYCRIAKNLLNGVSVSLF